MDKNGMKMRDVGQRWEGRGGRSRDKAFKGKKRRQKKNEEQRMSTEMSIEGQSEKRVESMDGSMK